MLGDSFSSTLCCFSIYRVSFVRGPSPGLRQHEPRHGEPPQTVWKKKKKACLHFTPRAHQQVTSAQTCNTEIILLQTENTRLFTSHTEILPSSHAGVRNGCILYNQTHAHTHTRAEGRCLNVLNRHLKFGRKDDPEVSMS